MDTQSWNVLEVSLEGSWQVWLESGVSHTLAGGILETSWGSLTLRTGINGFREVGRYPLRARQFGDKLGSLDSESNRQKKKK